MKEIYLNFAHTFLHLKQFQGYFCHSHISILEGYVSFTEGFVLRDEFKSNLY